MTTIRVLVIDDDPRQLELVDRALSRDGFELRCATSPDGLDAVTRDFAPQIVLLDVNMPDVAPERIIAHVRDACRDARIVLYSAWDASKLRKLAGTLGVDSYLTKSESVFAIGDKLRELARGTTSV